MNFRHPLALTPALTLSLTLALTLATGCGQGKKRRPKPGSGARAKGLPIPLRAAATVDTRALHSRLRVLLARLRPPIALGDTTGPAPANAVARAHIHLLIDSLPPPKGHRPRDSAPLRIHVLGADTVAVLTNATNPMDRLHTDDLRQVLGGRVQNWKQMHGPRLPLIAYTLAADSDLTALLGARLTGGKPFDAAVRQVADVATLLESIRRTPGALGLLSSYQIPRPPVGKLTPPGIKLLALSRKVGTPGYLATDRAAATKGHYPLLLPVTLLISLPTNHPARSSLDKMMTPKMLPHLSAQLGLVPLPPKDRQRITQAWARWNK